MDFELLDVEPSCEIKDFMNISRFPNYYNNTYTDTDNNVILMEYDDFSADLYKSFKYNSQKILTLFKMDVPRETLMINGVEYNNAKKAFKMINKLIKIMKLRKMVYMLCTQAVMYIPCYLLTSTYCNNNDYYLGETRERESMIVDIKIDDINNSVNINKVLRIFYVDVEGDKTYTKIKFNIHVELGQSVILSWFKYDSDNNNNSNE